MSTTKKRSGAKQSPADRQARLDVGRCPIHGIFMYQESRYINEEGDSFCFAGCTRKDCFVFVKAYRDPMHPDFRVELLPEMSFLIVPDGDTPIAFENAQRVYAEYRNVRFNGAALLQLAEEHGWIKGGSGKYYDPTERIFREAMRLAAEREAVGGRSQPEVKQ